MSTPLRALIVEDSEDDATLLLRELRRAGYEIVTERVETAEDMKDALERAEWDVILSDYTMPRFSAPHALDVLKKRQLDIPFIIVSGTIGEETAVTAMKAGAQDFILKGKLTRLVPALERELRDARIRRERLQAEEALRQSEERFRQIAETIEEVFWIADPDITRVVYVSPAYKRVWGRSITALYENSNFFLESIHSEDRERVLRDLESRKTGQPVDHEYRIVRPDASVRWIWDRSFPVRDEVGQVIRFVGVAVDITERKLSETENARLALIVNSSDDAIYSVTREGLVATWNIGAERMYGYSAEEIIGKPVAVLFPEDRQSELAAKRDRLYLGEALLPYEFEHLRKDGSTLQVLLTLSPIKDAAGVVTGVSAIARDITQRKRAEAEKARLVTAIEHSAEGVVISDTNGDIEYVNPAFSRTTGYSREEVLGHNPRILKSGKQDPLFYQQLWTTILKGETWRGELINRRKDGQLYTAEMNIAPVRSAGGEVTHFIATQQDVSERKRLEDQFRQAQKMEAVGRLAGGVAHDFNNLLTIINGYSDLALEGLSSNDPLRGYLAEIRKAGDRAASLTRQMLGFSRQQVLAPRVLDLNALVADMEKMLRRLIGEDIHLATIRDAGLGRVKADPGQIDQVLINLAVNAREAMPHGGRLSIETANVDLDDAYAGRHAAVSPGRYVMLAVSDTGIGMNEETQSQIFEPFFTTKEPGKGTGLGLAMVYGTVKQSGGFIWVYSEPGRGATFKIYLPRVDETEESIQVREEPGNRVTGSETVLVVEDDEAVRAVATRILQAFGYKVLESTSPEDALQIGERYKEPIDLLLTDVVLPRMNGRKVAEHLKTLRPGLRVLYMSGYTDTAVVTHGVLRAGTDFLQKPFTPASLARKVREVLDANRKERCRPAGS